MVQIKCALVVVHYKDRQPGEHFFDDKETAIDFRRKVNKSIAAGEVGYESVSKAVLKGWRWKEK